MAIFNLETFGNYSNYLVYNLKVNLIWFKFIYHNNSLNFKEYPTKKQFECSFYFATIYLSVCLEFPIDSNEYLKNYMRNDELIPPYNDGEEYKMDCWVYTLMSARNKNNTTSYNFAISWLQYAKHVSPLKTCRTKKEMQTF